MVVARVIVLILFLAFVGLSFSYSSLSASVARQEAAWSASLSIPSAQHTRDLRQWLTNNGVVLKREGAATRLSYSGTHSGFQIIVNRLLNEPVEWVSWSAERLTADISPTSLLNGSIVLKNL